MTGRNGKGGQKMKKELGGRSQTLQGLADSLDILGPAGLSEPLETENERKNRELCWRSRLPVKPGSGIDNSVDVVVLPGNNEPRLLLRFMGQLYEGLHDQENYSMILHAACSSVGQALVTILIQPTKLGNLVIKLANMPEVEEVREEPPASAILSSFPVKFACLPMSSIGTNKRLVVTLQNTEPAYTATRMLN